MHSGNTQAPTTGRPGSLMRRRSMLPFLGAASLFVLGFVAPAQAQFGTGADGAFTVTGTVTLTGSKNYTNLTVDPGATLNTQGYILNVSGTLLNNGTITDLLRGGNGGTGGPGGPGGNGISTVAQPGQAGAPGTPGSALGAGKGGNGGGGGGGGGAAWDNSYNKQTPGGNGGTGGVGGQGGGVVKINVSILDNQGIIHADGLAGLTGNAGGQGAYTTWFIFPVSLDIAGGGGGGGGGGYGGDGGTVSILYGTAADFGTIRAFPGGHGLGGPGGPGSNQSYNDLFSSSSYLPGAAGATNAGPGGSGYDESAPSQGGYSGFTGGDGIPGTVQLTKYTCCVATVGNVDCSVGDGVDIGDLTVLVDNLFISFKPLCCPAEANCDGDLGNNVDIGDLTVLIDNLFITFAPLPLCH